MNQAMKMLKTLNPAIVFNTDENGDTWGNKAAIRAYAKSCSPAFYKAVKKSFADAGIDLEDDAA